MLHYPIENRLHQHSNQNVQYSTEQYYSKSTVQYSTVQYSTVAVFYNDSEERTDERANDNATYSKIAKGESVPAYLEKINLAEIHRKCECHAFSVTDGEMQSHLTSPTDITHISTCHAQTTATDKPPLVLNSNATHTHSHSSTHTHTLFFVLLAAFFSFATMTTVEGGCTRARRRRRSHALPRRKTVRWSPAEVDGLLDGVREHGVGKWAAILRSSACFNAVRTSVDLKDKWRNLAAHVRALALQSNGAPGTTTTTTTSTAVKTEIPPASRAQGHRPLPYSAAPPPPPPPLHPTALPPLAPSTSYTQPPRYTPRVLAPLPVPSLAPTTVEDAAAVAAAAAHNQMQVHHAAAHHHAHAAAAHHAPQHHTVSADLSYFGDSFTTRPSTADTLAQLRTLPPPAQHHTPHDAVPTAASPSAPPPALNFDPFPESDL